MHPQERSTVSIEKRKKKRGRPFALLARHIAHSPVTWTCVGLHISEVGSFGYARTYPPFVRCNSPGIIAKHFAVAIIFVSRDLRDEDDEDARRVTNSMFTHRTNRRLTRTVDRLAHSRSPNVRLRRAPNRNSRCQRRHCRQSSICHARACAVTMNWA